MKRWILLAGFLLLIACDANAQVSVTGNVASVGAAAASNSEIVFELQNYGGNIPKVSGTSILGDVKKIFTPDGSGNITGTLYGNDVITPTTTFYTVCVWTDGRRFRCANYRLAGATFDLDTATPITTSPVVAAPTGDTTYLRTDGGNATNLSTTATFPFGVITAGALNNILFVDGVKYATIQAAITDCGANPCTIIVPSDYAGADPAGCAPVTVTIWDLRRQIYTGVTSSTHYAFNIWDGCPVSKWLATNTGGQIRSKFLTTYAPQAAAGPGEISSLAFMIPFAGVWPVAPIPVGNSQGAFSAATMIQSGTDTITNATINYVNTIFADAPFLSSVGNDVLLNDLRASHSGVQTGGGSGQINSQMAYSAAGANSPAALHVGETVGFRGYDAVGGTTTLQLSGNLSVTNGNAVVNWVSGDKLAPNIMPAHPMVIGGVTYIVSSCLTGSGLGGTQCTLGTVYAGATSGSVAYAFAGRAYSAFNSGNQRYDATGTGLSDPLGGGGILFDAPSGGSATQQKIWFRDPSTTRNADGTYVRMGFWMGTCFDGPTAGMGFHKSDGTLVGCVNTNGTAEFGQYCNGTNGTGCIIPPVTGTLTSPSVTDTLVGRATTDTLSNKLLTTIGTATNCSSSAAPAVCSAAPAGSVVIAAAATTVTVNTTAVTANSQITVFEDSGLGTKLSVTCNTTIVRTYAVTARTAATSFTITTSAAPTTNPACLSYSIVN